jgi:alpha-L-rhamnosidase
MKSLLCSLIPSAALGLCRLVLVAFCLCVCSPKVAAGGVEVVHLRCESQVDPLSVDAAKPLLSWTLSSNERKQRQTAYRILVASSQELLKRNRSDQWDSGKVPSSEQNGIEYGGPALRSNQQCFWKVMVWDQSGKPSRWSGVSRWTMGLLGLDEWKAKWIQSAETNVYPLPLFRHGLRVEKPVQRALVYVCGLGQFDLFLDGAKVSDHFLDPAWSVYEKTAYYVAFDVTEKLRVGNHAFGVMLGKGFFNTDGDRRVHGVQSKRPLRLLFQAHIWYADGTEQTLVSDDSWRVSPGPITHSAILGGEDYDARLVPAGWSTAGFNDQAWKHAAEAQRPGGILRAALSPPMKVMESFRAVRIDEPASGKFVYDFGQNASAIPKLRVRGRAGAVVRLTPAEQRHGMTPRANNGQGLVNQAGVGSPNYFQYTLRGGEAEEWTPQFSYSGFQYLQIEGAVPAGNPNPGGFPVIEELVSLHVRNTAEATGRFECSHPLLNRIDRIIDRAVQANMAHVLTDCPHREKLGWLEVSYLMGPSIAGRYDISRFYSKVSRDCGDSQESDGLVPTVAPSYPAFSGGFAYTPEWGAAAVVVPWQVYEWYGDRRVLQESYATMKGFVDFVEQTSTNLVPRPGLGDWYDYGGKTVGPSQFTPVELSAMATFYRCARIVADTASLLGEDGERSKYDTLAQRIRTAFNERYFNGVAEYKNSGSPQTGGSMALALGMVPAGREQAVLERILQDVKDRNDQQTVGDIGHWYFLKALADGGQSEFLYRLTTRTNMGGYGFIVNNGWTSMPEAWDADTGASMNHCMLGHIQEWFLGYLGGIRPDPAFPGFQRVLIEPQVVGDLQWAKASHRGPRGEVRVSWDRRGDRGVDFGIVIPPNSTAQVRLPAREGSTVKEGGRPIARQKGVRLIGRDHAGVKLELQSGVYALSVE